MSANQTPHLTTAGLNLIQQALSIYDADLRLAVCNRRFQEMFGLPDDLVTPGADFAATIRYLAQRGDYGDVPDLDAFVTDRVNTARAFEPHYVERTRANGDVISIEGSPLPQGGWVTVYTDITRTRRQETLLAARSEELSGQLAAYSAELASTNRKLESTITALEEAKRQITEAEARMRLTTEMMPAHIAHLGPDQHYTYSNRRISTIMPGAKLDPVGQHPREVLGDQAYDVLKPHLLAAYDGTPAVFEFTHDASSRRIRVALTPDPATGGAYILTMDITEETQTRAALAQTRRREVAAQMASGLAHDFSNLLTIILGMQSRLGTMQGLPQDAPELIAATLSAARRGGSLLNRISHMTGPRDHSPQPTDIAKFLNDLTPLAHAPLPDTIQLEIVPPDAPLTCLLDPGMLQDSLINLVLNARDAIRTTASEGTITITATPVQDTWLDITVTDTGPGFSDHLRAHAFDPFFTTKGGEGSGLGLPMVYDMTTLAGGRVLLDNAAHGGGRVTLRLPLRAAPPNTQPGLVLLVEDSPDLRDTIRAMLIADGHTVIEASSAPEALTLLRDLPQITAILSDISLEGVETGIDLLTALPQGHPPAVLMTSRPPSDPLHQAALAHAPVLLKPFDAKTLRAAFGTGSTP